MYSFVFKQPYLKYKIPLLILLLGIVFVGGGIFIFKFQQNNVGTKIEVLDSSSQKDNGGTVTAEISGEVMSPGVYKLKDGERIDDLLVMARGLSINADRAWTNKYLNRAAKVTDGQKVFIPEISEHSDTGSAKNSSGYQNVSSTKTSDSEALININTAGMSELDSLPGIGPVYGQNIIDHRPYSTIEELVSKDAIKQNVFEKIKDKITIY
jgi:competence protein ComEA